MRKFIYAATLNIDKVLDQDIQNMRLEKFLMLWFSVSFAWAYAFTQVIFSYQVVEALGDKLFIWIRSFTFALAFVFIIALLTNFFLKFQYKSFTERFYLGVLAQTPVIAISVLAVFFNFTYQYGGEQIGLVGFFPEHVFVLAGFFSVFSTLKLISRILPFLGVVFLLPNLFLHYFFLVVIFYRIFQIY